VVLGDLNDNRDAKAIKEVIGRGRNKLVDARPIERNGDASKSRGIAWTHYYALQDIYSRLDYLLLSRGMARHWLTNETYVLALPDWGLGSDHRPLVAAFETEPGRSLPR
jgi:endonuclease/exonuclease/phosphatase family metal-dependent hydrolase